MADGRTWDVATLSRALRQTVHDHDDARAQTRPRRPGLTVDSCDNTNQDDRLSVNVRCFAAALASERTQRCDLAQSDERLGVSAGSAHQTTAAAAGRATRRSGVMRALRPCQLARSEQSSALRSRRVLTD